MAPPSCRPKLALCFLLLLHACHVIPSGAKKVVSKQSVSVMSVMDYGAKGDGRTDDSGAITRALNAACISNSDTVLSFPAPRVFYSAYPLLLSGPCNSALTLLINGTIKFNAYGRTSSSTNALLEIKNVDGVTVTGPGVLHGSGITWWSSDNRPSLLRFSSCVGVTASAFTTVDPPMMHVVFNKCQHVVVNGITTSAPSDSPNTDSIHLSSVSDAFVTSCMLSSGDDCVSIVGDSSDVLAFNLTCTSGHGYSIGSLGYGGDTICMSNITVKNSVLIGTANGLRIKSYQGGKGIVDGVLFENIYMKDVYHPIILNQFYCDIKPCTVKPDAVAFHNIVYKGISGTTLDPSKGGGITFNCSSTVPCSQLKLHSINIVSSTSGRTLTPFVMNAFGTVNAVTSPDLPLLSGTVPPSSKCNAVTSQAAQCGAGPLTF